jgi:hypothetical protein
MRSWTRWSRNVPGRTEDAVERADDRPVIRLFGPLAI